MSDCNPSGITPAIDDPCAMLSQLRAAYLTLLAGQARATVRNGDQWLEFQRGDSKTLQREIRRFELLCGPDANAGRAIRVGPYVPFSAPYRRNYRY